MDREERRTGLTKDAGWQIGVRKTLPIQHEAAWRLLTSAKGLRIWLGPVSEMDFTNGATCCLEDGTVGEVRVFAPNSHLRMTWQPAGWERASTIQLRVIPKGDKTVIAFHQEHLPDAEAREKRRLHFKVTLARFERIIGSE